jgi:hypothetical protein
MNANPPSEGPASRLPGTSVHKRTMRKASAGRVPVGRQPERYRRLVFAQPQWKW